MAHGTQCIGTWKKSKLGTEDDGDIRINSHSTNTITGLHVKTNSAINGTCTGQQQSFSRTIPGGTKKVHYKNGNITQTTEKFLIKGKFAKDADANVSKSRGKKKAPPADDWTAEKPT